MGEILIQIGARHGSLANERGQTFYEHLDVSLCEEDDGRHLVLAVGNEAHGIDNEVNRELCATMNRRFVSLAGSGYWKKRRAGLDAWDKGAPRSPREIITFNPFDLETSDPEVAVCWIRFAHARLGRYWLTWAGWPPWSWLTRTVSLHLPSFGQLSRRGQDDLVRGLQTEFRTRRILVNGEPIRLTQRPMKELIEARRWDVLVRLGLSAIAVAGGLIPDAGLSVRLVTAALGVALAVYTLHSWHRGDWR